MTQPSFLVPWGPPVTHPTDALRAVALRRGWRYSYFPSDVDPQAHYLAAIVPGRSSLYQALGMWDDEEDVFVLWCQFFAFETPSARRPAFRNFFRRVNEAFDRLHYCANIAFDRSGSMGIVAEVPAAIVPSSEWQETLEFRLDVMSDRCDTLYPLLQNLAKGRVRSDVEYLAGALRVSQGRA